MADTPTNGGSVPNDLEPALRARFDTILNNAMAALQDGRAKQKLPDAEFAKFEGLVSNALSASRQFFRNLMDPRRDIDDECGYPRTGAGIDVETYRQLYDREPIATRVCQVLPKECWQVTPLVYEDEGSDKVTEFEEAWDQVGENLMGEKSWHLDEQGSVVWDYLMRADIQSGIGHFGILLLGFNDGRRLDEPVDGAVSVLVNGSIGDSYMARDEEDALLAENRKRKVWNIKTRDYDQVPDLPLTENERQVVRRMSRERVIADQHPEYSHEQVCNVAAGKSAHNDIYGSPMPNVSALGLNSDLVTNDPLGGPVFTDSTGLTPYAMGAMGAQGTEQQYFGVQFGPSEAPADKPAKKRLKLLFLRCFDESLVQIVRYEWNVNNPRFGSPIMYRVTLNDPREQHSGIGLPMATVFVHWTRVIHLADNRGSSEIFGVPRPRPVLNPLLDIRKVRGASAEGYWRSCFTGVALSTHPQLGGDVEVNQTATRDVMEQYMNGLQRYLLLMGMSAETLAPSVVDPSPFLEVQIEAICIQLGIPIRVFKGSERGELASSQDDAAWNDRLRHRQNTYLTPRLIVPFINRLILVGVLPEPQDSDDGQGYHVEWPDLDSLGDKDKAAISQILTACLAQYVQSGAEQMMPFHDFLTRVMNFTEEEADEIVDAQEQATEKQLEDHGDLADKADEHDLQPTPPAGFHNKPEPPPPGAGMPGGPPMPPQKLGAGQSLVHPQTGATVAKGPPVPKPKAPK